MAAIHAPLENLSQKEYQRRINAWTLYDWANSAFVTTILAAVLPIYFSQVAGATLPSEAVATAYWSLGLSISLLIVAILSPILGTISDIARGKKAFLAVFAGIGIIGTALLVFVSTGDWMLASILAIVGRIGLNGSVVFYDALLPHVAKPADQDRVSALGYAMGYLGGGILLAINIVMIFSLPGTWGPRLSFLSVAIWWAVFSIPLFLRIPEPQATGAALQKGVNAVSASFAQLRATILDIRRYKELFQYLIAFLIYNDGIGTIIGVAAIYGAELGFGSVELILALLLVQFVGIPFSLIFGSLPNRTNKRQNFFTAFVLFNLFALPLVGIGGRLFLTADVSGAPLPDYIASEGAAGQGTTLPGDQTWIPQGNWQTNLVPGDQLNPGGLLGFLNNPFAGDPVDASYLTSTTAGDELNFRYNGKRVEIIYQTGPAFGTWGVEIDGQPFIDEDTGEPLVIEGYSETVRYGLRQTVSAETVGIHELSLINLGPTSTSNGSGMAIAQLVVLAPERLSSLPLVLGMVLAVQAVGLIFAYFTQSLFKGLAASLDTKRTIILALVIYAAISVWGFFLDSTVEFWFLAWMVAIVQGGSQALSRSLYASMSPASKSGEFFGLFGVMEKFASLIGPLLFAAAALIFGSSRPAILSLIALFLIGIWLLTKVDVEEGKRVAQEEDRKAAALTN